jgi:hypothetical protein
LSVRFTWDDENLEHIGRHVVTPGEVEQLLGDYRTLTVPARAGRLGALGVTAAGRPLRVVFDLTQDTVRVTTAYPITAKRLARFLKEAQSEGQEVD